MQRQGEQQLSKWTWRLIAGWTDHGEMHSRLLILTILPFFVLGVLYVHWDRGPFNFDGPLPLAKAMIWIGFAVFSIYSGYCTLREDIFQSVRKITRLHFGRQICIDLYLGTGLILFLMYLNEPTFLSFLVWMVPTLFYVNILTLLYFAIHFDSFVTPLLAVAG